MSKWLWVIYPTALAGICAVWGGVIQVLLGRQIASIVPNGASAAATLGLVMSLAAVSSVISHPVVGWLSDKTPPGLLGRRNSWILGGSVLGGAGLVLMSTLTSTTALAVCWAIILWPLNGVQAGLGAVLPERVPIGARGRMSGLLGAAGPAGSYLGVAVAGLSPALFQGYLNVAGVVILVSAIFAFTTKDAVPLKVVVGTVNKASIPTIRSHPDFWLTFASRFALIFGYFSVVSFQLYILRDYIHIGTTADATRSLVGIMALSTALNLLFAVAGGFLSDRFGRMRVFVVASSLLFIPAAVVYLLVPTLVGAWIGTAIMGAAFGMYNAVDYALISRVLPSGDNAARDLGIMNIANSGPQIIAPGLIGAIVGFTGDYRPVFLILILMSFFAAVSVRFIKTVP